MKGPGGALSAVADRASLQPRGEPVARGELVTGPGPGRALRRDLGVPRGAKAGGAAAGRAVLAGAGRCKTFHVTFSCNACLVSHLSAL